jgi:hypothetical protein
MPAGHPRDRRDHAVHRDRHRAARPIHQRRDRQRHRTNRRRRHGHRPVALLRRGTRPDDRQERRQEHRLAGCDVASSLSPTAATCSSTTSSSPTSRSPAVPAASETSPPGKPFATAAVWSSTRRRPMWPWSRAPTRAVPQVSASDDATIKVRGTGRNGTPPSTGFGLLPVLLTALAALTAGTLTLALRRALVRRAAAH